MAAQRSFLRPVSVLRSGCLHRDRDGPGRRRVFIAELLPSCLRPRCYRRVSSGFLPSHSTISLPSLACSAVPCACCPSSTPAEWRDTIHDECLDAIQRTHTSMYCWCTSSRSACPPILLLSPPRAAIPPPDLPPLPSPLPPAVTTNSHSLNLHPCISDTANARRSSSP